MALGVFVHRTDSIYDDSPAERYQFPAQYLGRASACVGDWVLYYEPVKVRATRGYFAVARVQKIIPDPVIRAMYVAVIEPGSYLEFANPSFVDMSCGVNDTKARASSLGLNQVRCCTAELIGGISIPHLNISYVVHGSVKDIATGCNRNAHSNNCAPACFAVVCEISCLNNSMAYHRNS